ncbi:MAG TPA: hypothetical protein DCY13_23195 [Verrucomicrobiales bacterium]|nr:hypothetical protein [Verrucomicrobiales bacterium]
MLGVRWQDVSWIIAVQNGTEHRTAASAPKKTPHRSRPLAVFLVRPGGCRAERLKIGEKSPR